MVQISRNDSSAVSTTSAEVMHQVPTGMRRVQFAITNTSAAAICTVAKGDQAATAGSGFVLNPNGFVSEADDGGYRCWQGPIQVVSNVAGTVAIVETFEARS